MLTRTCFDYFRHHAGRHGGRHHHGFFGFGNDFGEGMPGGVRRGPGGFGPGRKLGSSDLQLLLLALLADKPSHGYELIKALGERSSGYYSPSPGMVYPALTYLEEIGHAAVETEGTRKLYRITDAGRDHLEKNRAAVDTLLQQIDWLGKRMEQVRQAMAGATNPSDAGDEDNDAESGWAERGRWAGAIGELRQARRSLKLALFGKIGANADVQRKVAEILERAAAEIRNS
ncbi:MAG TPA: PadR family transcriptional regulator [Burkholderiaceae bacterium]|nr:PadR family transcriptional regulator [Burkholderiaceae bacterium]